MKEKGCSLVVESTFIGWLHSISPDVTVFLSIIIVIGGAILSTYKITKKFFKDHDDEVSIKTKKDNSDKEFKREMLELVKTVNTMQNNIDTLESKIDDLTKNITETENKSKDSDEVIVSRIDTYEEHQIVLHDKLDKLSESINLMIESDKESIRSFITIEYYKAVNQKYIEVYVLQAIEYRYEKYLQEHGDSFISTLMEELRKLPHTSPVNMNNEQIPCNEDKKENE